MMIKAKVAITQNELLELGQLFTDWQNPHYRFFEASLEVRLALYVSDEIYRKLVLKQTKGWNPQKKTWNLSLSMAQCLAVMLLNREGFITDLFSSCSGVRKLIETADKTTLSV